MLPYSSASSSAATLGLRTLAATVELLFLDLILRALRVLLLMRFGIPATRLELLAWLLSVGALWIPFYGLTEGLCSASPGKRLVGLRVVGTDSQPITFRASFARAALWWAVWAVPSLVVMMLVSPELLERRSVTSPSIAVYGALGATVSFISVGLLFVTARRSNGFAGVHDLATRTRVVSKFRVDRLSVTPRSRPMAVVPPRAERIEPYVALAESSGPDGTTVAFDERLARRVWIRRLPPGTPPLPPVRRDLGRPARLHWLGGRRGTHADWDAFEAVEGEPLLASRGRPRPWSTVRCWLLDLAEEIDAMSADGTVVSLSTGAVWIDGNRARLLDWRPAATHLDFAFSTESAANVTAGWQQFLCDVAAIGLDFDWRSPSRFVRSADLPLHGRECLEDLANGRLRTPAETVERLRACTRLPGTLTRARRGAHLAVCGALPGLACFLMITLSPLGASLRARTADFYELQSCLARLEQLDRAEPTPAAARERAAIEVYIVGRFRRMFVQEPGLRKPWFSPLVEPNLALFQRALERYPKPSDDDVRQAAQQIAGLRAAAQPAAMVTPSTLLVVVTMMLIYIATLGLIGAFASRGGVMLRALGLALVGPDGREVSRLRAFVRAAIAWSPVLAAFVVMDGLPRGPLPMRLVPVVILLVVFSAGAIFAFLHPPSGVQDRLARTRVVAR